MIVPTETDLRSVLTRFSEARIRHDVHPTGSTSRSLQDATYTLCVMTGTRHAEEALRTADLLLARSRAEGENRAGEDEALAA